MITSPEELENRFNYHPPKHEGVALMHEDIRAACKILANIFNEIIPDGREASLAMTKLEEAMFWANAAIARKS